MGGAQGRRHELYGMRGAAERGGMGGAAAWVLAGACGALGFCRTRRVAQVNSAGGEVSLRELNPNSDSEPENEEEGANDGEPAGVAGGGGAGVGVRQGGAAHEQRGARRVTRRPGDAAREP